MKNLLLSRNGGDRATAYTMSNKLVRLPDGWLVTWIDSERRNQWVVVDPESGRVLESGPLGAPCVDNHCGAALVRAGDEVHAVTGGHHGPFEHYRRTAALAGAWQCVGTIDVQGTYPGLAADSRGRVHLAFRSPGDRWTLDYCRFDDGAWTPPRALIVAEKPGYIYWTNGLAVGPDDALHLVFGNTRVRDDKALFYGASHLVSPDGGETWRDDSGAIPSLPAPVSAVPLMVAADSADRIQSPADQEEHDVPGPRNTNYRQIILSNPVVDADGGVHVILHNGLTGTADLMSLTGACWRARPLTAAALGGQTGRMHVQSSLALGCEGRLFAALMIEDTEECIWGPPGTRIVRLGIAADGAVDEIIEIIPRDPTCAQWLPAQPHGDGTISAPPLLYTRGTNAGGFGNNTNAVKTEVHFCVFG